MNVLIYRLICFAVAGSGMQRFLDAQGQRGSWMPRAGQIPKFFCPEENLHFPKNVSRKIFDSSRTNSDDLFQLGLP